MSPESRILHIRYLIPYLFKNVCKADSSTQSTIQRYASCILGHFSRIWSNRLAHRSSRNLWSVWRGQQPQSYCTTMMTFPAAQASDRIRSHRVIRLLSSDRGTSFCIPRADIHRLLFFGAQYPGIRIHIHIIIDYQDSRCITDKNVAELWIHLQDELWV